MSQENRLHPRLEEENRVAVTVVHAQNAPELENQTFFCPTEDISASGLKLSVPTQIPSGSSVELRVALLKPLRSFLLLGDVRWSRKTPGRFPFAVGIRFKNFEGPSRALWQDAVNRKLTVSGNGTPPSSEGDRSAV